MYKANDMEGAKSHHEMFRRLQEQLAEISDVEFKDIPLGSGDNNDWSNILIWYLTYDHPEYFDDPLARMARGVPFLSEDFPKYYTMLLIQLEMTDLDNAMQHLERSLARFEYKLHKLKEGEMLKASDNLKPKSEEESNAKNDKLVELKNRINKVFKQNGGKLASEGDKTTFNHVKSKIDEMRNLPFNQLDYGVVKSSEVEKKHHVDKIMQSGLRLLWKFVSNILTESENSTAKIYPVHFKKSKTKSSK